MANSRLANSCSSILYIDSFFTTPIKNCKQSGFARACGWTPIDNRLTYHRQQLWAFHPYTWSDIYASLHRAARGITPTRLFVCKTGRPCRNRTRESSGFTARYHQRRLRFGTRDRIRTYTLLAQRPQRCVATITPPGYELTLTCHNLWNIWNCSWTTIQWLKKFFSFLRSIRIDSFLFFTLRSSHSCFVHWHIISFGAW